MTEIPKVIHFIYPWTEKTRPWSLVNTLAVRSAKKCYPDHEIIIWTNAPTRVPLLNVTVKNCDLPTQIGGVDIEWPQYVADVMRLDILYEHGGIYMDTDIISLSSFVSPFNCLNMSWETKEGTSISNAMMSAPPKNLFIKVWLDRMPEAVKHPTWAYGGVVLPYEISQNPFLKDDFVIWGNQVCCPLDLSKNWMFDPALKQEAKEVVGISPAIHIFETYWRDIIKDITPEWIEQNDCLFSELIKLS
jgi:hypothetical protein